MEKLEEERSLQPILLRPNRPWSITRLASSPYRGSRSPHLSILPLCCLDFLLSMWLRVSSYVHSTRAPRLRLLAFKFPPSPWRPLPLGRLDLGISSLSSRMFRFNRFFSEISVVLALCCVQPPGSRRPVDLGAVKLMLDITSLLSRPRPLGSKCRQRKPGDIWFSGWSGRF